MSKFDPAVVAEVRRELAGLGDAINRKYDSMRRDLEALRRTADVKSIDGLVQQKIDRLSTSVLEKVDSISGKGLVGRLDRLETALRRPALGGWEAGAASEAKCAAEFETAVLSRKGALQAPVTYPRLDDYRAFKSAFARYLRKDKDALTQAEVKALSAGSDPDGGYLVVSEMSQRIVSKVFESSPLRAVATVETIGSDTLELPIDEDEAASGWAAETAPRTETATPKLGKQSIATHELWAFPMATQRLLDDASLDIETWLAGKIAEKFARDESTAFMTGDGTDRPRGLLTYPDGTARGSIEQLPTRKADGFSFDGIIGIVYALKEPYAARASWLIKRESVAQLLMLKDNAGNYLYTPPNQSGQIATLYGYPLRYAADLPSVAAGALVAAFGDFAAGYTIVDRLGIRALRDPYTKKPFVGFYTTKRVGGDVVTFEAVKLLKVAA
jgi:HK97 family phage major capsid protein